MSASTEPAGDAELLRLLDAYGDTSRWGGEASVQGYRVATRQFRAECRAVRAALLAHIAAAYVRRDAIYDEWDHLDTTAPLAGEDALPGDLSALRKAYFRGEGPTLADVKRAEATVLLTGRGPARAARYGKEELADGAE